MMSRPIISLVRGHSARNFCAGTVSEADPVAFLGLGAMGFPMAGNLSARNQVMVWNRTESVAMQHADAHGTTALKSDDFSELSQVRAVFLCLPTSTEVEKVLRQAAPHLRPGVVVVDCTSGHPLQTRKIADWLSEECGAHFMDCAVSGGPRGARKATLAAFVGCDEQSVVRSMVPDIECFAQRIVHLGPASSGHATKAVNNALNVSNLLCVTEGLLALKKIGIAPERALAVINKSSGRSLMSEERVPNDVISGWFNYGFKLGLMKKDVDICNSMLDEHFDDATIIRNTGKLMSEALDMEGLHGDSDYTEVIKILESRANATLREENSWEWSKS